MPGFELDFFYGIAAPTKVPPDIVLCIRDAVREITERPEVRARMLTLGMAVDFRTGEQFRDLIVASYEKYGTIVRDAGISAGVRRAIPRCN